jgi:DNA polymerase-4/DNA polymerase V
MKRKRAILHIDGDAFFAMCEVARNPWLRGKPVVTGRERGIVSAATYEAKKLGIHRAMPIKKVMREFPDVTVLSSDYGLYGVYGARLYAIVRRYADTVEEYGVDECFGDLTGADERFGISYEEIIGRIKRDLSTELALSFSAGLAPTKALAKIGSKLNKPDGLTLITDENLEACLSKTKIGDVWGIGRALSVQLEAQNIYTALDFVRLDTAWVEGKFAKPTAELQRELRGEPLWDIHDGSPEAPHSIQRTRTFAPPSRERNVVWSQFSRNVEEACATARREGLIPARVSFFLKSQEFKYWSDEVKLPHPSDMPQDILRAVYPRFLKLYERERYRATGVTLFSFRGESDLQLDLWEERVESRKRAEVFRVADRLEEKYGEPVISLATSLVADAVPYLGRSEREEAYRARFRIRGTGAKHLPVPVLGEVR